MPWSATLHVTDCSTGQALKGRAVAETSGDWVGVWNMSNGLVVADQIPDSFTEVELQVNSDGYIVALVTVSPGDDQAICLTEQPSPDQLQPPVITSYWVTGGTLTVEFESGNVDSFNMRLVALDGPFPGQPSGQRGFSGDDRRCIWEQVPGGHSYRFSIQGCVKKWFGIDGSECSDWRAVEFDVSVETGWPT